MRPTIALTSMYVGAAWSLGVEYEIAVSLRSAGAFYAIRGGAFTNWTLFWVDNYQPFTPLYARFNNYNHTGYLKSWRELQQPAPWNSDYGIATSRTASPVSPVIGTQLADAIVEFTWTVAAGETLEIYLRQSNSNNRYIVRCSQVGSTIKLIRLVAGGETEIKSTVQTFTNLAVYRLLFILEGGTITGFVGNNPPVWQQTGETFNLSATGIGASGFATGSNLIAWPRSLANYPFLG